MSYLHLIDWNAFLLCGPLNVLGGTIFISTCCDVPICFFYVTSDHILCIDKCVHYCIHESSVTGSCQKIARKMGTHRYLLVFFEARAQSEKNQNDASVADVILQNLRQTASQL